MAVRDRARGGGLSAPAPAGPRRGVDVYALDRRGSGCSGGLRGHLPSAQQVLEDHAQALDRVAAVAGSRPLVALGQSLGGSILAALWAASNLPGVRRLVFCAPALGQQRTRHTPDALRALRAASGEDRRVLPLDDGDYTSVPRYSAFMANDHLMVRQVTVSTLATLVRIEDVYADGARPAPLPVTLVRPERDPIIDLDVADSVLRSLSPEPVQVRRFDADRHYLEFSSARSAYWDWLAATVVSTPPGPAGTTP